MPGPQPVVHEEVHCSKPFGEHWQLIWQLGFIGSGPAQPVPGAHIAPGKQPGGGQESPQIQAPPLQSHWRRQAGFIGSGVLHGG